MPKKKRDKFDEVVSATESLIEVSNRMVEFGVFDREEGAALSVLVNSLSRALKVLDKERYGQYLDFLADREKADHDANCQLDHSEDGAKAPGLYL